VFLVPVIERGKAGVIAAIGGAESLEEGTESGTLAVFAVGACLVFFLAVFLVSFVEVVA
jgi:hypothetical protein